MSEESVFEMLSQYRELVDEAIERLVPRRLESPETLIGKPRYSYEPVSISEGILKPFWELMDRGGKRWRPALTFLAYEALGGRAEDIAELAALPEIIHNATLIVDDVEDGSILRRGKPCIHKIYGVDIAINAGNALYYIPVYTAFKKLDERRALGLAGLYLDLMTKLSLGQAMDIAWHRGFVEDITEDQYLQMCVLKTGSMSRFAVELACIMAGCDSGTRDRLARFGESIGVAFQIQDDLLNLFGDESKYGKELGGDITEGKKTLLTIYAARHLPEGDSQRLREILAMHTDNPSHIAEAIRLIRKSGADTYARKVAASILSESWADAEKVLKPSRARDRLAMLARFLIERSR
ncbi:Octaprenyl diphosphate synthase [archaeon HR01]|nr:Octaprenyl diphosphate synthase [archaeon HR01]